MHSLSPLNPPSARLKADRVAEKTATFCLGVIVALLALPLLIALRLISEIVPEKQWEDFWDSFVEDSLR